jgi:hypothetical protein
MFAWADLLCEAGPWEDVLLRLVMLSALALPYSRLPLDLI